MVSAQGTPAGWYPDPLGHHEHRWFDGVDWTASVSSHGQQTSDPMSRGHKTVVGTTTAASVRNQVVTHDRSVAARSGGARVDLAGPISGELLEHLLVVINQKTKLFEVNTEFAIHDSNGVQIGAIRQVGQNGFKRFLRFVGHLDQYFTHSFQLVESSGAVALTVTRPAKIFKSRVIVGDAAGREVGRIVQKNVVGKIRFDLEADGRVIGAIRGENWRAWNFRIEDESGMEVARITKTFEGLLRTAFTTADNYVLQVHRPLEDPLRQLVFASAVTVDVALKQDARGLSGGVFGG
jgi:uncharacterized protein YxjI